MRIATVVGARPQFVKAAPMSVELSRCGIKEIGIHTGQHFDENMSGVFYRELGIPKPEHMLNINGGSHGEMTGRMLTAIESVLLESRPDAMLVYGDTNSTLAGALAAVKLHIPVIHVEAGLRSFNRSMPEEINRVLTDHMSALLFCPTTASVSNLADEGITNGVHNVGDIMYDATLKMTPIALRSSRVLDRLKLAPKSFCLATIHRAENTDSPKALRAATDYLKEIAAGLHVVLPLHPRTRSAVEKVGISLDATNISVVEPLSYFDMQVLLSVASLVVTDSGGVQKEAYFHRVPCVTMRSETEWVETIESGWNRLWIGPNYHERRDIDEYGAGQTAKLITQIIQKTFQ
jgi:UDP-GlcNAc3NAcA epimerase